MLVQQNQLTTLLNKVLGQFAKYRKGGSQILYHCPFCKEGKRIPKLEICLDQNNFGKYHCWICNVKGGSILSLFKKLKAKQSYYVELYNITKDESVFKKRKYTKNKKNEVNLPAEFKPIYIPSKDPEYKNAFLYLKNRGVTRDDILRYNIGYCDIGEYKNRIIIPSYDSDGNLNYFVARAYYDSIPIKYKNCPYSKDIIGFELFINWNEQVTICEGIFDAIAIRKNAIPLFGKIMSDSLKIALIENGVAEVNVCLDNDALKDALEISQYLISQGIGVNVVKLENKDPSSMGFEQTTSAINSTTNLNFSDILLMKMNT